MAGLWERSGLWEVAGEDAKMKGNLRIPGAPHRGPRQHVGASLAWKSIDFGGFAKGPEAARQRVIQAIP